MLHGQNNEHVLNSGIYNLEGEKEFCSSLYFCETNGKYLDYLDSFIAEETKTKFRRKMSCKILFTTLFPDSFSRLLCGQ